MNAKNNNKYIAIKALISNLFCIFLKFKINKTNPVKIIKKLCIAL